VKIEYNKLRLGRRIKSSFRKEKGATWKVELEVQPKEKTVARKEEAERKITSMDDCFTYIYFGCYSELFTNLSVINLPTSKSPLSLGTLLDGL